MARKALAKARTEDSMSALSKLTRVVDGELRIVDESPLVVPIDKLEQGARREAILTSLRELLGLYRDSLPAERRRLLDQYELADFARVGSGAVRFVGEAGSRTGDRGNGGARHDGPSCVVFVTL